ncbi:MAG TPA: Scr1 family TA system antitoxin-like transcriptional regulator, partial [Micromonosporaceae bacterium]|nr:Scr1 family TA system antitoxin-like transcriptional regulator [Micromonosporaceae bacterium]
MSESNAAWFPARRTRARNGVSPTSSVDGTRFAPVYAINNPERGVVVNPFLAERKSGWWDSVGKDTLVDDALVYVELESEATKVRTFKIDLVDGLMQTPEYTAAVIRANQPWTSEALIRRRVGARNRRQARLHSPNPIHLEAIITEGALRI